MIFEKEINIWKETYNQKNWKAYAIMDIVENVTQSYKVNNLESSKNSGKNKKGTILESVLDPKRW